MTWQISSILAAVFFAGTMLPLKWASRSVPSSVTLMVYLYSFTLLFFGLHAAVVCEKLKIPWMSLGILFLSGILCYAGNYFQVRSITEAPNPGYALAIIASYIVLVTIASIFLFASPLSLTKAVGIGLCAAGVVLLSI